MMNLDERQALEAMRLFLTDFFIRTDRSNGGIATLLTDTEIQEDGGTHDPAAWPDWLRCVSRVTARAQGGDSDQGAAPLTAGEDPNP
jgi:hypothetical protein